MALHDHCLAGTLSHSLTDPVAWFDMGPQSEFNFCSGLELSLQSIGGIGWTSVEAQIGVKVGAKLGAGSGLSPGQGDTQEEDQGGGSLGYH